MDEAAIIDYIRETHPNADILTAGSGTFFSLDAEEHWPNFATRAQQLAQHPEPL